MKFRRGSTTSSKSKKNHPRLVDDGYLDLDRVVEVGHAKDFLLDDEMDHLQGQADMIRRGEEPFVLLIDLSDSWQQVVPFIKESRRGYLPGHVPLIILCSTRPTFSILEELNCDLMDDRQIGIIQGDTCWSGDLSKAGVHEAEVIAVMEAPGASRRQSGSTCSVCGSVCSHCSTHEPQLLDQQVTMLFHTLVHMGISGGRFTIFEFKHIQNLKLLPPISWGEEKKKRIEFDRLSSYRLGGAAPPRRSRRRMSYLVSQISKTPSLTKSLPGHRPSSHGSSADTPSWHIEELLRHPRFASGQIFTPIVLGTVLARTFYMPGIIEVMHSLLMLDFYGQHCKRKAGLSHMVHKGGLLWQIKPPPRLGDRIAAGHHGKGNGIAPPSRAPRKGDRVRVHETGRAGRVMHHHPNTFDGSPPYQLKFNNGRFSDWLREDEIQLEEYETYDTWGQLWQALFDGKHHSTALAMGLYRLVDSDGGVVPSGEGRSYVVTLPDDSMKISDEDLVFVLASESWGQWASVQELLVMASGAVAARRAAHLSEARDRAAEERITRGASRHSTLGSAASKLRTQLRAQSIASFSPASEPSPALSSAGDDAPDVAKGAPSSGGEEAQAAVALEVASGTPLRAAQTQARRASVDAGSQEAGEILLATPPPPPPPVPQALEAFARQASAGSGGHPSIREYTTEI